ncbi:MAG: hypothetical protein ACI4JA_09880 [Oscillospiraceae bacterium]
MKKAKEFKARLVKLSETAFERAGKKKGRSLHITGASCLATFLVGLGKLVMGIISLSFFTCVSAIYTFGMVAAKITALAGILKEENSAQQYRYYKLSGIILTSASTAYIFYSLWIQFHPPTAVYHLYIALGIATVTFAEIAINIRGVIIESKGSSPLFHALKMINLASSLISLVLVQNALLSITHFEEEISNEKLAQMSSGLIGIFMGTLALILGIIMLMRLRQHRTTTV